MCYSLWRECDNSRQYDVNGLEGWTERANMPRKLPADIDEQVLTHIRNSTAGLSLDELLRLLKGEISRRSLQRRLSKLVDAESLITEGGSRSTRYLLPKAISKAEPEENYVR